MFDIYINEIEMHTPINDPAITLSQPEPSPDIGAEVAKADLIVVATVTQVKAAAVSVTLVSPHANPIDDQVLLAELDTLRILAGEHRGAPLRVFFLVGKAPSRPWIALTPGQTFLLFLRSTDRGYVPVAPAERPIHTLRGISRPPANSIKSEAVAHELEQIVLSTDPTTNIPLILHAVMARMGLPGDVDLHLLGSPELRDPGIKRAAWIALALAQGKVEVLKDVPPVFATPMPPSAAVLRNIIVQKVSEIRAWSALPHLSLLLQSPVVPLVRATTEALRHLHNPAAIPALASMLNHPDQLTRYHALMGITELEPNAGPEPAFELFRSNEAPYLHRVKQWLKQQDKAE